MIGEDDKVYNDEVRRFGDMSAIKGAQVQNKANIAKGFFNGIQSDFNDAAAIFGLGGGNFGMFGGGKQNATGANPNPYIPGWNQWQQFKIK
jgi:hypothetical protein